MKPEDRKSVSSVIDANSRWVTLQQLAARGKSHVRVISRKKALELIEAVVDDAIRRGSLKVADADRQRIVDEANDQFQSVSRIQAESEAMIRQQKEILARQQTQIQKLEQAEAQLKQQIESGPWPAGQWQDTARAQAQALEDAQGQLRESIGREQKGARALRRLGRRLVGAGESIAQYDREIERLAGQVKEDAALIDQLRSQLHIREQELGRVRGLLDTLSQEMSAARARSDTEHASIIELRGELGQMKTFLQTLEERRPHVTGADVEAMLDRITQKEADAKAQLEQRVHGKLNDTLDRIGKDLRLATARPIDRPVEATDVYISKVFDDEAAMECNLQALDVQATTAKQSISQSLERLKRLRSQASEALEEDSGEQQEEEQEADGL